MKMISICLAIGLAAIPAYGQEPKEVVPVESGKVAPFTGLLVPEQRFTELLEAEVRAEGLSRELKLQEKYTTSLEAMFNAQLKKATEPEPWYKDPRFNLALGVIVGVAVTSLAVYGGAKIVGAAGNGN